MDLTPGDGARALAAVRARVPYVGITLNKAHKDHIYSHIDVTVLKMFQAFASMRLHHIAVLNVASDFSVLASLC